MGVSHMWTHVGATVVAIDIPAKYLLMVGMVDVISSVNGTLLYPIQDEG